MYRTWLIAAALLVGPANRALADENSGLYLGAGLGDFSSEIDDLGDVDLDFEDDSDATRVFAGWRFNRWIAAQVDFLDFGDSRADVTLADVDAESRGIAPSLVGTLPLLGPAELFAKAGILFYDVDVNLNGESLIDESGEDVVYGAGIGVTLLERLAIRAEYEVVEIDEFDDAEAFWLTAAWRF